MKFVKYKLQNFVIFLILHKILNSCSLYIFEKVYVFLQNEVKVWIGEGVVIVLINRTTPIEITFF